MIKVSILDWNDFKDKVISRELFPQWYIHKTADGFNDIYKIYAMDGFLCFEWYIEKNGDPICIDFETNFKDSWNRKLDYRDSTGFKRVHTSPRPDGNTTYFTGSGDGANFGEGSRLIFSLSSSDNNKYIDIFYNETITLKDAITICKNAPIGSYFSIQVLDQNNTVLNNYINKSPLLGDNVIYFNSEDIYIIEQGNKLRCTVYNASGIGDEAQPVDFNACISLEMYRTSTI